MSRPTRYEHHRYVGDKRTHRFHDLDETTDDCGIDDLMASGEFLGFGPDTPAEARNRGFGPCPHCVPVGAASGTSSG